MALTKIDDRGLKTPIDLLDNEKIRFGTGNDLELYHDGTNSNIYNATGELRIRSGGDGTTRIMNAAGNEHCLIAEQNAAVSLYYDNSKKFETTSTGTKTTGKSEIDGDVQWNGSDDSWGAYWDKSANSLGFKDDKKITLGTGNDLELYHNGTHSWITNTTGSLFIKSDGAIKFQDAGGNEDFLSITDNGAVELYYDNSKEFQTVANGIELTSDTSASGTEQTIYFSPTTTTDRSRSCSISGLNTDGNNNQALVFKTSAADTPAERLRIDSSGNVGIGTTSPATKLHVDGTASVGYDATHALRFYNQDKNNYSSITNNIATGSSSAQLAFRTGQGEALVIQNDKNVKITDGDLVIGTSGHGIDFSATSGTGTSELFDDYEEGDWTPTSSQGGWTYSNNYAKYTKIGRTVYVQCYISISGSGTSSSLIMGGLPFTSTNYAVGSVDFGEGGIKGNYPRAEINNTTIEFFYPSENTSSSRPALAANQIGSSYIILSLEYTAA